jgi:hypothetical protein
MPTIYKSDKPEKSDLNINPSNNKHDFGHAPHVPMKALAAYAAHPNNVKFETQDADEVVELFLRQHQIVNVPWIIISLILIITPVFLFPFISVFLPFSLTVPIAYAIIGTGFWYLAVFGYVLVNFIQWYFNIYIVTSERIVDIDFKYLLYKHIGEAELDRIEDISYSSGGFLAALFDFGTILIQTAGETQVIEFEIVPHPDKVVEAIRSVMEVHNEGGIKK